MNLTILIDLNLSPDWIAYLGPNGFPAVHWSGVGDVKTLDSEIMAWARANDHIVLTHDLDFGTLLALTNASGPSVIQLRCNDPSPQSIGASVLSVLTNHESELKSGALAVIDLARSRIRVLPL